MSTLKPIVSRHDTSHGSLKTYTSGYVLSIVFTLTAYLLVTHHASTDLTLSVLVVVLAIVQFIIQLVFFLHLGRESKPRWKLLVFGFMLLVVSILVFGSLWIMNNLNYRMMSSPTLMNNYMQDETGF